MRPHASGHVRFHHFDFFQKGTRQGNGAPQRRANCPLQAVFVKTVPKRVPEMASARRSYGNDKCARSGDEKHTISDGTPEVTDAAINPRLSVGEKPCRFARVGGNLILKVFRHCRSLGYNWLRSMHGPLSTTTASLFLHNETTVDTKLVERNAAFTEAALPNS